MMKPSDYVISYAGGHIRRLSRQKTEIIFMGFSFAVISISELRGFFLMACPWYQATYSIFIFDSQPTSVT